MIAQPKIASTSKPIADGYPTRQDQVDAWLEGKQFDPLVVGYATRWANQICDVTGSPTDLRASAAKFQVAANGHQRLSGAFAQQAAQHSLVGDAGASLDNRYSDLRAVNQTGSANAVVVSNELNGLATRLESTREYLVKCANNFLSEAVPLAEQYRSLDANSALNQEQSYRSAIQQAYDRHMTYVPQVVRTLASSQETLATKLGQVSKSSDQTVGAAKARAGQAIPVAKSISDSKTPAPTEAGKADPQPNQAQATDSARAKADLASGIETAQTGERLPTDSGTTNGKATGPAKAEEDSFDPLGTLTRLTQAAQYVGMGGMGLGGYQQPAVTPDYSAVHAASVAAPVQHPADQLQLAAVDNPSTQHNQTTAHGVGGTPLNPVDWTSTPAPNQHTSTASTPHLTSTDAYLATAGASHVITAVAQAKQNSRPDLRDRGGSGTGGDHGRAQASGQSQNGETGNQNVALGPTVIAPTPQVPVLGLPSKLSTGAANPVAAEAAHPGPQDAPQPNLVEDPETA